MSETPPYNRPLSLADTDFIASAESADSLTPRTFEQSAQLLALVCRDAAAIERERRRAGLPEPAPAPWPKSTWDFLAHHARRLHS